MKKYCAAVLCLMILFIGTVCESAPKDKLTIAINSEPRSLSPYDDDMTNGFLTTSLTFEPLITKDSNGKLKPKLAESWKWIDNTTLQIKLRKNVKFHDGSPFNADAVKFCLELMATSSFTKNFFGRVDLAKTIVNDPYTITIKLTEPYAPFLSALSSWRGAMISPKAYKEGGKDGFGRHPVGTGPMKFEKWVTGDRVSFSKNDDYWGKPLAFKNMDVRFIIEGSSRTMELETGGVDIAMDIPIADRDRIAKNPKLKLYNGDSLRFEFLLLNIEKDINKNIKLREAMAHAIDYKALVNTVWRGKAKVADSFLPPSVLGYKPVGPYKYDLSLAKKLLAESGHPNGFTFDFYTWENEYNPQVAQVLQSMWKKIGINMNVHVVDLPTFIKGFNAGEYQVTHTGATAAINDPDAALLIWPLWRTIPLRHKDQKIQDFLDKGVTTYDPQKRKVIYQDMMKYCFDQTYVIPLAYLEFAFGAGKNVQNLKFAPDNVPNLANVKFAD